MAHKYNNNNNNTINEILMYSRYSTAVLHVWMYECSNNSMTTVLLLFPLHRVLAHHEIKQLM